MSKTIDDFSYQWSKYTDNEGYYGSKELLADIVKPLLAPEQFENCQILEIGSGTGRIVNMLMGYNPSHVYALEPSDAFIALGKNTKEISDKVTLLNLKGDDIPAELAVDYVLSIGVIHHITNPDPVIKKAFKALNPGGTLLVWLYGKENNRIYLSLIQPLRKMLRFFPKWVTSFFAWSLVLLLQPYCMLVSYFDYPLPFSEYLKSVFIPFSLKKQHLVAFDQLNPKYAKYYTQKEAERLLSSCGFTEVKSYHRHNYSWTVTGKRPTNDITNEGKRRVL